MFLLFGYCVNQRLKSLYKVLSVYLASNALIEQISVFSAKNQIFLSHNFVYYMNLKIPYALTNKVPALWVRELYLL